MTRMSEQLTAFVAILVALVIVFDSALIASLIREGIIGKLEAFGLGTICGGLIGALRFPGRLTESSDKPDREP